MRGLALLGLVSAIMVLDLLLGAAAGCLVIGWWSGVRVWEARNAQ